MTNQRYTRAQQVTAFLARVEITVVEECWLWKGGTMNCGYGVSVWRGKMRPAHRIVWEIANGRDAPDDKDVLNACDTPLCVNPSHLSLGTPTDNATDMLRKMRSPNPKLTIPQVLEIKETLKNWRKGMNTELGKKYGVTALTILKIRKGHTYKFVDSIGEPHGIR